MSDENKKEGSEEPEDIYTKEQREDYVNALKASRDSTYQTYLYSLQRLDILIISISGAGIYVALEVLKYIHESKMIASIWEVKVSGILFVVAIITNCFSQWTAYTAHKLNKDVLDKKIFGWQNKEEKSTEVVTYTTDKNHSKSTYDTMTRNANSLSILAMVCGLFFLILYFCIIF